MAGGEAEEEVAKGDAVSGGGGDGVGGRGELAEGEDEGGEVFFVDGVLRVGAVADEGEDGGGGCCFFQGAHHAAGVVAVNEAGTDYGETETEGFFFDEQFSFSIKGTAAFEATEGGDEYAARDAGLAGGFHEADAAADVDALDVLPAGEAEVPGAVDEGADIGPVDGYVGGKVVGMRAAAAELDGVPAAGAEASGDGGAYVAGGAGDGGAVDG